MAEGHSNPKWMTKMGMTRGSTRCSVQRTAAPRWTDVAVERAVIRADIDYLIGVALTAKLEEWMMRRTRQGEGR